MEKITFTKRKLGSIVVLIIMGCFSLLVWLLTEGAFFKDIAFIIFIIPVIILPFAKEMTEIDFEKKIINQYFQILFLKISSDKKSLPDIEYILVWDLTTTEDISYYEISIVTKSQQKTILALIKNEERVISLIEKFRQIRFLRIVDNTQSKILSSTRTR